MPKSKGKKKNPAGRGATMPPPPLQTATPPATPMALRPKTQKGYDVLFGGIPEGYEDDDELNEVAGSVGALAGWDEKDSNEEDRMDVKNEVEGSDVENWMLWFNYYKKEKEKVEKEKEEVEKLKKEVENLKEDVEYHQDRYRKLENGEDGMRLRQIREYLTRIKKLELQNHLITEENKKAVEEKKDAMEEKKKALAEAARNYDELEYKFHDAQKQIKDLENKLDDVHKNQQQQQQRDRDLAEAHEELTKRHNRIVELNEQVNKYKQERDRRSVDFFRELKAREKAEKELDKLQEKPKPTYASIAAQTVPQHRASQVNGSGEGKEKEDVEMQDRFREYEDLLQYSLESEENPQKAAPPTARTPMKAAPPAAETPTLATKAIRAFVVHGIACEKPIASTSQRVERVLGRGIVAGARWLLAPSRRMGKKSSSVVYFLTGVVRMVEKNQRLKIFGKWHLVEEYDFARGRK